MAQPNSSNSPVTWLEREYGLSLSVPNVGDRYELFDEIGKGGVAQVYIGQDRDLNRQVAIKILRADRRASRDSVLRFLNEARITSRLQHPGIVPIHDIGLIKGELFFAMELVDGRNLRQFLDARGGKPGHPGRTDDLVRVFEQICHIVAYAHNRGVVHRDLKPENIMVGEFNKVYVMDWGLALDLLGNSESPVGVLDTLSDLDVDTQRLQPLPGTPKYMAPEQILGMQHLDHRCDVFALGLILYEILAGRHPYEAEGTRETMHGIKSEEPPPIETGVSRDLKLVCMKALQKLPAARYANAAALADDVHRALNQYPVSVERRNLSAHIIKAGRRHWLLGLGVLLLAIGIGFWGLDHWRSRREVAQWVSLAQERLNAADRQQETLDDLQQRVDKADPQWRGRLERNLYTLRARQQADTLTARLLLTLAVKRQGSAVPAESRQALLELWLNEIEHELDMSHRSAARRIYAELIDYVHDDRIFQLGAAEASRLTMLEARLRSPEPGSQ